MLSRVVRVADQCYNKRSIDLIKWVNGETDQNPIADMLN
jgi:hypothetical protein